MPSLAGKRILVTGGSRGLGAEISKQLAGRGAIVAINYSAAKDRAEETLKGLEGKGHAIIQGDAFSHAGIDGIVKSTREALGGIDGIVSNHGWTKFGAFNDLNALTDDDWMQTYSANVMSHLWLMQASEEELKKNKGGFIISASVAGLKPGGSSMAYSTSKAACVHLTKCLAKACAPNVRVNAVAPGLMLTEWAAGFSQDKIDAAINNALLKKVSEVDDVAAMYISLLENDCITGQVIEVSSGIGL